MRLRGTFQDVVRPPVSSTKLRLRSSGYLFLASFVEATDWGFVSEDPCRRLPERVYYKSGTVTRRVPKVPRKVNSLSTEVLRRRVLGHLLVNAS